MYKEEKVENMTYIGLRGVNCVAEVDEVAALLFRSLDGCRGDLSNEAQGQGRDSKKK